MLGQHRHEYEQAPHAVDDGRDAGEQFDRGTDRRSQPGGRDFGQEQRDSETGRYRDDHRDRSGGDRLADDVMALIAMLSMPILSA